MYVLIVLRTKTRISKENSAVFCCLNSLHQVRWTKVGESVLVVTLFQAFSPRGKMLRSTSGASVQSGWG